MRVLIAGARGQLGRALVASAPDVCQIIAPDRASLDLARADSVRETMRAMSPDLVINAAAYTAVDRAESESEAAHAVNVDGARVLAESARGVGARVIHVSTDYVFDGARGSPYRMDDAPNPLNVYGRTKLAGERAVLDATAGDALVLRASWLHSADAPCFTTTMLRLMRERGAVRVVADQVGCPTSSRSLARAIWRAAERPEVRGIHHWRDAGVASWYDLAVAIAEEARALDMLDRVVEVAPIATAEYPTPARRPPYSVLDIAATCDALEMRPTHWRESLREVLREMLGDAALTRGIAPGIVERAAT